MVDIDVPTEKPVLVVDAALSFFNFDDLSMNENSIRLSLTASFFDSSVPPVSNANVFITNLQDNTMVSFV